MFSLFVALVVVLEMCVLKVSVRSSVIPKNLASFENLIGLLFIRIGVGRDAVFELKERIVFFSDERWRLRGWRQDWTWLRAS